MHFWPANSIAARAIIVAEASRSASSRMIAGFWPPISACAGTPRPTARRTMSVPTATLPVNDTPATRGSSTSAADDPGAAATSPRTPGGRAAPAASISRRAVASALDEGLNSAVFPYASAGASFHTGIATGKFQGQIAATTPSGRRCTRSSAPASATG